MSTSAPVLLHDLLCHHANRLADQAAISAVAHPPLTYAALWSLLCAAVRQLNQAGIGRNDRVAVVLPNGPEMAITFLAVAACATCAPLNPAYREQEFDFYLSDLNASAVVVLEGTDLPVVAAAQARNIPILRVRSPFVPNTPLFILPENAGNGSDEAQFSHAEDIALVLHTSGTTARPKIVPLTQHNLCVSARNIQSTLGLAPHDRCLNIMPLFHIHGLVGALLATITAGAEICCTPGYHAPSFVEWMSQIQPTWYTAVPTMHQAILGRASSHADALSNNSLRLIRSSSSALPPQVMVELERVFGCPVIESYGMTEAAHQMASNPLPPRTRKPGSVGVAAGPEIAIMDPTGNLLSSDCVGEVVIRGESVFQGYAGNPEANASAFTGGWFRTGDQGFLDAEGYLFLTGRLKELINRGGEKIAPREIDEALLEHPDVAQAVVFAIPHAQLGEDVAAAVVLRPGATVTGQTLRVAVSHRLSDFKVPARILILEEIPKGPTGKVQRIGMAERLGMSLETMSPGRSLPAFVAPHTPIEEALADLWAQVLGVESIGIHDNFLEIGGDSLLATQFVARLQDALDIRLTLLEFFEMPTIAELAPLVETLLLEDIEDVENLEAPSAPGA